MSGQRNYDRESMQSERRIRAKRDYDRDNVSEHRKRSRNDQSESLPEIYSIFRGEVISIQEYGAFVKLPGYRKNGLVHKSQISTTRVEDVAEVLAMGDKVFCKVISLGEDEGGKISLSMKVVSQEDGRDMDPNLATIKEDAEHRLSSNKNYNKDYSDSRKHSDQKDAMPEIYSILRGEVVSIQEYGAFIKFPGYYKNGLVHKSQISKTRVEDVAEVLAIGDKVFCKIISLGDDGGGKMSLSMKVVNQGDGKDLDPNLVMTNQEESKRNKGGSYTQKRIELGAVFNTVCKKCGTKGHLSQNCFQAPGSKTYEILPELDLSVPVPDQSKQKTQAHKKKKKKDKKKHKKSAKKKRKTLSTDSDSSSDSDSDSHKRHSKKHRHRKHRDSNCSVSNSSDSDNKKGHRWKKKSQVDSSDSNRERRLKHKLTKHHRNR